MKNKLSPLDELRQEKEIVKRECIESEDRLLDQWSYLSDNAGSLIFNGLVNSIVGKLGFSNRIGGSQAKEKDEEQQDSSPLGIFHNVVNGVSAYYPLIWEIVQPMLWRYAMKKVKSIFSGKKKKKRKDDDD